MKRVVSDKGNMRRGSKNACFRVWRVDHFWDGVCGGGAGWFETNIYPGSAYTGKKGILHKTTV